MTLPKSSIPTMSFLSLPISRLRQLRIQRHLVPQNSKTDCVSSNDIVIISATQLYNFYCDTDTVWRSNPLDMLEETSEAKDLVAMVDNSWPPPNGELCSCYLYFKPTKGSFHLLDHWKELIQTGRFQHDQAAFHKAYMMLRNNTSIQLYDPDNPYFPNGNVYFNEFNETQRSQVLMVHKNFVFGYEKKKERFIMFDLWHPTAQLDAMEYKC